MVRVIAVFGLSGVGKSWLISRFASANAVLHVQASQLLRDLKKAVSGSITSSEDLRRGPVLDNQALLISAFSKCMSEAAQPIIFDGHCVIDSGSQLVEIPVDVIQALSPAGLVFLGAEPCTIVERRLQDTVRIRPSRSEKEIEAHQDRAISICDEYAKHLQIDLHVISAGDERAFASKVETILANAT